MNMDERLYVGGSLG